MSKLKKVGYVSLGVILGASLTVSVPALAATVKTIQAKINSSVSVVVDGKKMTTQPINYQNLNYLPVGEIGRALDADVSFDKNKNVINIESKENSAAGDSNGGNSSSTLVSTDKLVKLDSTALKLNLNNKEYGLASSTSIYLVGKIPYIVFNSDVIDLIISIASNDYFIYETNNDNPDFVTANHYANEYKYLEVIEKQKSYKLKSSESNKTYDIALNNQSSIGVLYNKDSKNYLVPLNDVFNKLELKMEAVYEPQQEKVFLKFK
ncbi:hypothetical protein Q9R46_16075 [Paenibacillus sp. RRE4]|uniref:hypothetical protein n=1 Tax=Paenibacillus sp. RRE4 TaxID=2962587 RepID=UPI0028827992|nr:hypothetical protein [Paenibacillus sp. RRE4]MDT0124177.1 hypothetical protein [Paenibacillus sp. RRE4]